VHGATIIDERLGGMSMSAGPSEGTGGGASVVKAAGTGSPYRWAVPVGVLSAAAVSVLAAFRLSPWPAARLIRLAFDAGAARTSAALAKHVPPGVESRLDIPYRSGDPQATLDIHYPPGALSSGDPLPVVVWTHGGGFVSGDKSDITNYAKVLAGRGFAVVSVGYTSAPEAQYPTPIRQANAALGHLAAHAEELHLDPSRFALAGDSAGSQIAAQVAALTTNPAYATLLGITPSLRSDQLQAMVLTCGVFDLDLVDPTSPAGRLFFAPVLWAYSGTRAALTDETFRTMSVTPHVTADFPPSFITAGNGDPLLPHSTALAARLEEAGVDVHTLFYPADHSPALPHEYQFDLDSVDGRNALERIDAFLRVRLFES
jgi:acetyl esterase/lipase